MEKSYSKGLYAVQEIYMFRRVLWCSKWDYMMFRSFICCSLVYMMSRRVITQFIGIIWKSKILLEDKFYVIGPGPWLRPLCRDQERDFVQKSGADAIYWNINICRELLIPSFENFNGTVSNQEKKFFHSPESKISSHPRKYDFFTDQRKKMMTRKLLCLRPRWTTKEGHSTFSWIGQCPILSY